MNKIILIGNLAHEPKLTETSGGTQVCKFSIAVNRNYANADGERETDFFNCVAWRSTAEAIARYAHKGNKIAVIGSVQNRTYETQKGEKRNITEVMVAEVEFLAYRSTEKPADTPEVGDKKPALEPLDYDGDIPF